MSGYTRAFYIGGRGGFQGADGINPIDLQILVGDGNRQWLEPIYYSEAYRPIGNIRVIIPEFPDHSNALLDACIAFAPRYFESCPSLSRVSKTLATATRIDFNLDVAPEGWEALREEASSIFENLPVYGSYILELADRTITGIPD